MDAEIRLAELAARQGCSDAQIARALMDPEPGSPELEDSGDLLLRTLAREVRALGGRLELRAVIAGQAETILSSDELD